MFQWSPKFGWNPASSNLHLFLFWGSEWNRPQGPVLPSAVNELEKQGANAKKFEHLIYRVWLNNLSKTQELSNKAIQIGFQSISDLYVIILQDTD